MATLIMLPDGVTGTNQWLNPSDGTCAASNVDNDDGNTDYCYETLNSQEITFTMATPSVASAAIDSITNVKISLSAAYTLSPPGTATRVISSMTGTGISNGTNTHEIDIGGGYATYSGAVEAYATGTTAWNYLNLGNLQIKLDKLSNVTGRTQLRVSYLYATVTYVAKYPNDVLGVDFDDIGSINGIATGNISKVNGV